MAAGIFSTIAQILLWWSFWDALPSILYRDARFAAAIILGRGVLPPPATLDWQIMFIATWIHFGLSIIYAILLSWLIHRLDIKNSLIVGLSENSQNTNYDKINSYLINKLKIASLSKLPLSDAPIVGSLYGLGLFVINMYGFVIIFPWFVETRDWITVTAHVVFGVSAAGVYKILSKP